MDEQEIVFSDKKRFTIEATVHNQNDRSYTKSSADIDDFVRIIYRQKNPFSLMVWAAVSKS